MAPSISKRRPFRLFRRSGNLQGVPTPTLAQGDSIRSNYNEQQPNTELESDTVVLARLTFSDILKQSLPTDITNALESSNEESFTRKVKEAGATAWSVLKRVLKVVKEASAAFPPLQGAIGGLLTVLEQYEIMEDVQDDFLRISQKMAALHLITTRYDSSNIPETVKDRLQGLSNWINSVTISIKMQPSRRHNEKLLRASEDHEKLAKILRSLAWAVDLFMLDTSIGAEEHLSKIETKVDNLAYDSFLDKLNHVTMASFIAQRGDMCLEGTRCSVIADILEWCSDASRPPVYWLNGMAGTGKSAIARSVCDFLETAGLLGGSFFCSRRASAEEQDIRRIIPTLAWQLCRLNRDYLRKVVACLERNPDIVGAKVVRQLEEMIIRPYLGSSFSKPVIIVIGALDEGARADDTAQLLEAILGRAAAGGLPVRFFVTSRPESHIRSQFSDPSHPSEHAIFCLHDIEKRDVEADIHLYVTHRLHKIKINPRHRDRLPVNWPEQEEIEKLVVRAENLFIYAFTACNYIESNPYDGLDKVITATGKVERPLADNMDEMYTLILDEAMNPSKTDSDIISTIRNCLAVLVYVREIFSLSALTAFIGSDVGRLRNAVDKLHSLILIPSSDNGEVAMLHASLGDYITDNRRSGKHFIPSNEAHFMLLQRCFTIMDSELRFNVAQAQTSFKSNKDQGLALPQHLLYAAGRWPDHVIQGSFEKQSTVISVWTEQTLMPKFLFWLEVISVAERVKTVPEMLQTLLSFVKTKPMLILFINDGIYFAYECEEPISLSTPHIYLSALAHCWKGSIIREIFCTGYSRIAHMKHVGTNRLKVWELCLIGHSDWVTSVAFSCDGTRIISGSQDRTVRVWDAQSGQPAMRPLQGHTDAVASVVFSPNGSLIASGSYDKTVRLWDARNGHLVMPPLQGHTDRVTSVAFSLDNTRIVSGSSDKKVRVWDIKTGQSVISPLHGHDSRVNAVGFSPDGTYIISGSLDKTVRVWNARTGQAALPPLYGHTDSITSVTFSPDGNYIVSGSNDNTVRIWDVQTGQLALPPLRGHADLVRHVTFSPDGHYILSGSDDRTIQVWNAKTGRPATPSLQGHTDSVNCVAFSPDGHYIVSGSSDKTVRVWDIRECPPATLPLQGHTKDVSSVSFSPDGTRIASGSHDKTVQVWDAQTGEPAILPLQHDGWVTSVSFTPNGTRIVSGSSDTTVRVWDVQNGQLAIPLLQGHTDTVTAVACSLDGTRVVSGSSDKTVRVWDLQTGQVAMPPLQGHTRSVDSVAFSPNGTRIVSGSDDTTILIWNAQTGQPIMLLQDYGDNHWVNSVRFSPDGTRIVSGSRGNTALVWDVDQRTILPLGGHVRGVTSAAFSPDGTRIVTGSYDREVRVWDVHTSRSIIPSLQGHSGWVTSVGFSPDGNRVVSGSRDNTVKVSELPLPDISQQNKRQGTNVTIALSPHHSCDLPPLSQLTTHVLDVETDLSQTLENPMNISHHENNCDRPYCSSADSGTMPSSSLHQSLSLSPAPPFQLSQIPLFRPNSRISDPRDLFSFDTNSSSWIRGPNNELFIWIPRDLRSSLYMPRTVLIIHHTHLMLDLSNFVCGEDWTSCRSESNIK